MCFCVSDYLHMFICVSVYMCLLVCLHVSVCLSVSLWVVYMSMLLYVWESICVSLPVSMYRCGASVGLTLRGRGLPVHVYRPVSRLDQWYSVERSLVVGLSTPPKITTLPFHCISREKRAGDLWRTVTTALLESLGLCLSTHHGANKVSIYRCRNQG